MKKVIYGQTNKEVTILGFGGLRFDLNKRDEELSYLVEYAYDKGINYFDTAPGYCDERSETILGIAFRRMLKNNKKDFFVSTKGRPTVFDTEEKAIAGVKASLEKLGVKKIDFYHVWCLRSMDHYQLAMKKGGQYAGLLKCQEEGLIDHIVFSSHQPGNQVKEVLDQGAFSGVTMGLNILNYNYRRESVLYAKERGYGVVAMNPLSGGAIPQNEDKLAFLGKEGESATRLALRFNLSCPEIDVTLVGFSNEREIDEACEIAEAVSTYDDAQYSDIQAQLGNRMAYICTSCGYCRVCPVGINIPGYMLFYNEKEMFNRSDQEMVDMIYGLEYWNYTQNELVRADACIGCKKCEAECTQHLPIVQRLKEIASWESSGKDFVKV
jgi:predicted aldo/keto reductase-like oxidoreductase